MKFWILPGLTFLLGAWLWDGAGAAALDPGWVTVARGLEYREVGDLHQLRCDPASTRLGLLVAPSGHLSIGELVDQGHCLAGINGGYFDTDGKPMGYQRDQNRVVCPTVRTAGLFGGVFVVGPRGAELLGREDFLPEKWAFALQCGPRLIYRGQPVPGIHADPPTRRTGLGVDRQGRIFLYATGVGTWFTFAECQKWLAGPSAQGGLDPVGVLNLDGGPSTQMSVRTAKLTKDISSWAKIPVGVGVFAR